MNSNKLLFPIILIIAAGLIFYLFISPTYADVQTLKVERAKYNSALADAKALQTKLDSLRSKLNNFSPDDLNRLNHMLPNHVDNVRLILELDSIASRHNMAVNNVNVSGATDNNNQSNSNSNSKKNASKKVHTVKAEFHVKGNYDTLLAFLTDLEKSLRIVDINSVTFSVPTAANTDTSVYDYSITISTYWLNY
jgi:type IV pilus assembly protein PilO